MQKLALKIFGPFLTVLFSDSASFDRYIWLKKKFKKGKLRALDAGCGSGALSFYAAKCGNEVVGISVDKRNNAVARARTNILGLKQIIFLDEDLRKLDQISAKIGTFDQIICFETIEHILNDRKLVKDFFSLLNPGGKLILTTPYKHYRHFPGDYITEVEDGSHVRWGYEFGEMRDILEENKFVLESEEYLVGFISQIICRITKKLDAIYPHFGWFVTLLLRPLTIFDWPLTKIFRYPYWVIAVVARKK